MFHFQLPDLVEGVRLFTVLLLFLFGHSTKHLVGLFLHLFFDVLFQVEGVCLLLVFFDQPPSTVLEPFFLV